MRCPVCRAEVERGPQCRRCRADLSLLFALEDQRRHVLREAYRAFDRGDMSDAVTLADHAHNLRQDEESARLLAVGCLLQRDFASAWRVYAAQKRPARPSP